MFTFVSNIPISRRLFYAFLLAATLPALAIASLGIISIIEVRPSQSTFIIAATIIAIVFTISTIAAIGYVLYRTITRPLNQLSTLTTRIARGETNARANIIGRDEIYVVANSMNSMLD